jgi:hypothetical protein
MNPSFRQACDHTRIYGCARSRLMHVRVQKYKDDVAAQLGAAERLGDEPLGRPAERRLVPSVGRGHLAK